jgi:ribosomal protein S18 acetylase RimI-like enzyme
MIDFTISTATLQDIPRLISLVNNAYRGEHSKKGWTTEAFLLEGNQRIDEPTLQQMMQTPGGIIKKCVTHAGEIVGCVYLAVQANELYLGMLSVSPDMQAQGIGKKILTAAEEYALASNCTAINMTVISVRQELINWYIRHGYYLTGETKPFPTDNRFGTPTQAIEFVVLQKPMSA